MLSGGSRRGTGIGSGKVFRQHGGDGEAYPEPGAVLPGGQLQTGAFAEYQPQPVIYIGQGKTVFFIPVHDRLPKLFPDLFQAFLCDGTSVVFNGKADLFRAFRENGGDGNEGILLLRGKAVYKAVLYQGLQDVFGNTVFLGAGVCQDFIFAVADAVRIEIDEVLGLGAFLRNGDKEVAPGLVTVHF